ncbi:uncharacterized protein LOC127256894 [Andrographis paniculata]|uniref:uncharacterized protein LOC127256894 n=1 Tax=Andrographis paniculata TaxID=175694 RepID=UPI0021E7448E|nr:uncharacterized protein LOC127256894 [Andrographis paniculata]
MREFLKKKTVGKQPIRSRVELDDDDDIDDDVDVNVQGARQGYRTTQFLILAWAKIEEIGKEYVVHVVTDNGANFKKAGKILEQRIPTLYWTPCAAHCLDLMLEDIGKLSIFWAKIDNARRVTTYIYKHARLLNAMREKTDGSDLVRPGPTRFATSFFTLQSLYKHMDALRSLFFSEDWTALKLANTNAGKLVANTVLSSPFWTGVEYCIKALHPLLTILRIVDGDEKPAMPELGVAMNEANRKIKEDFEKKTNLLKEVMHIIDCRWGDQMEVELCGAALFLNPSKYFDLKVSDNAYACKARAMFNDVLEKMVTDDELQTKICDQVDDYDNMRGSFKKQLAIKQQKVLDTNDVVHSGEDLTLSHVDETMGASANLERRNIPKRENIGDTSGSSIQLYSRRPKKASTSALMKQELDDEDVSLDDDIDDDDLEDIPSGSGGLELSDC